MAVDDIAAAHYRDQQRLARQIAEQAQGLWGAVEPTRVLDSWLAVLQEMLRLLVGGQTAAAAMAQPYLDALAAEQGLAAAESVVSASALAGVASDGRTLASLLMQPAIRSLALKTRGADDETALRSGLASLTQIVSTQIADTSRAADQVGITARREWVTYVRHVSLPACGRCIVLAARTYSWSTGFQRHPRCDCTMVPHRQGDDPPPSPADLIERMSLREQAKAFTIAGAEAIRLGADPGQIVNARRGMQTAMGGRLVTTEGTTVRGIAGKRMGDLAKRPGERYRRSRKVRPMPEQILADAGDDRERALELLEQYGYLLNRPTSPQREQATIVLAPAVPTAAAPYHRQLGGLEQLAAAVRRVDGSAERRRLAGGQSAATEMVILDDGTRLVSKVGMDWGDPDEVAASIRTQADAEQLASLLGRAIGAPVVGVYRQDADRVWMDWAEGRVIGDLADQDAVIAGRDGQMLGLLDHLIANADRNSGNIMVNGGRPVGIDHGWAWASLDEIIGPAIQDGPGRPASHYAADGQWTPNPLTVRDVDRLRDRLQALRGDFELLGRGDWLDYSLRVLDELGAHARGQVDLIA
ncbi:hypothetical protein [Nonomuraea sp. bgisy101]|uniref:VG15 protein n=1 Tax=Nonomuraea sp. bgisy101 TaxID=3413784 RepID=UPI003D740B4C